MRSSEALSFMGALCVVFGLGLATYQLVMTEAKTNSTWNVPYDVPVDKELLTLKRAAAGMIVVGVGAGLLLAGAYFERRTPRGR
jgi:hypothetical protein